MNEDRISMNCRIVDMRCKEVINVCDGCRLGFVYDIEVDVTCGRVVAIIVPGGYRFFGLFGREEDYVIPWDMIKRIGEDIILVDFEVRKPSRRKVRKNWGF